MTFLPIELHVGLRLAILLLLLLCSALVSGSETAFFSLDPNRLKEIKNSTAKCDQAIVKLLSHQDVLLATILIANNLVNICIVILSNTIIDSVIIFNSAVWEFVIKVIIVTFLLLLFGEIMPKLFASYNAQRFARMIALPITWLKSLLSPISFLLIKTGSLIRDIMANKRSNISMDELSDALEITENHTNEEKKMLSGIINFATTDVEQIMKPRVDIVALDILANFEKVRSVIIESGHSRIPVYEDTLDNIKGVLYVKDMLPYVIMNEGFEWNKFLRKAYFVPEYKKINDLMEEFQSAKVHMAIVVDEYGSTLGLISLEDILEEIVGEISDDSDRSESVVYTKLDDNNYLFDGKTHLNDVIRILSLSDDYFDGINEQAETLAGIMLEMKQDFLKKGEQLIYRKLSMKVDSMDGRRIENIRVKIE